MTFRATSTLALCALSVIDREPSGAYNGLSRPTIANHDSYGSTLFYRDKKISHDVYPII